LRDADFLAIERGTIGATEVWAKKGGPQEEQLRQSKTTRIEERYESVNDVFSDFRVPGLFSCRKK